MSTELWILFAGLFALLIASALLTHRLNRSHQQSVREANLEFQEKLLESEAERQDLIKRQTITLEKIAEGLAASKANDEL